MSQLPELEKKRQKGYHLHTNNVTTPSRGIKEFKYSCAFCTLRYHGFSGTVSIPSWLLQRTVVTVVRGHTYLSLVAHCAGVNYTLLRCAMFKGQKGGVTVEQDSSASELIKKKNGPCGSLLFRAALSTLGYLPALWSATRCWQHIPPVGQPKTLPHIENVPWTSTLTQVQNHCSRMKLPVIRNCSE